MQDRLRDIVLSIITCPGVRELFALADTRSAALTMHGERHAHQVMKFGMNLAQQIEVRAPGTFTLSELNFSIPVACLGHDIGRSHELDLDDGNLVDRHEVWGARIMEEMLNKRAVAASDQAAVLYAILNHRANGCLGRDALAAKPGADPAFDAARRTLAVTVLADKCVGDAQRVRTAKAFKLRLFRAAHLGPWLFEHWADEQWRNDFANYAIKRADLYVDWNDSAEAPRLKGAIVLKLNLDEYVCCMDQVFKVAWFSEAYHCCGKAAQVLGLAFVIDVNGQRWFYCKETRGWKKRQKRQLPRAA